MLFSAFLGIGLSAVPLLGVHGVESALFMGVFLPPLAAVIGARLVVQCRITRRSDSSIRLIGSAVLATFLVIAIPILILAFNALRVRNCDPIEGLLFMLLGPAFGSILAAIAGVVVSAWITRSRLASYVAFSLPFASIGFSLCLLYTTPAIFAYGHFFGYFPGTFYDENIAFPTALLTLRVATSALAYGLVALFVAFYDEDKQRLRVRFRDPESVFLFSTALIAFVAVGVAEWFGPQLGHRSSRAWIETQLEGRLDGKRCRVRFPRDLIQSEAVRLVEECDFRVAQMEQWFGVSQKDPVVAFYFRSAEQKRQLMGAYSTYIAKPWMNQVYLQLRPWPHPAIAHEIAHIVVANTGAGPFRISGRFRGLWPNPALIEGVAVAAAWSDSAEMTPHQWARAMIEIGRAPPLRLLFGVGFLGQPKRQAYTLAGSLLRFIRDNYGAHAIRRIYRTCDIESALGMSFDELEKKWRQAVMSVALPEPALGLAKARFAKRAIFSSVCPHQVARLQSRLEADWHAAQHKQAEETCREILRIEPNDVGAHTELVTSLARNGKIEEALRTLNEIERLNAPQPLKALAKQEIADAYWRTGRNGEALRLYRSLLKLSLSNDRARVLEVKILALEANSEQARLLQELLIGSDGMSADDVTAIHLARELRDLRSDGLPYYLEARQLYFRQRYSLAANLLQKARQATLPTKRLRFEALRLEGTARFAVDQFTDSKTLFARLEREADGAYRVESRDWMERIRYAANP